MSQKTENRGGQAPASCDLLCGASQESSTPTEWKAQLLAFRFCLPPAMAREVSSLLFGEASND
jgi:hypothetical protein